MKRYIVKEQDGSSGLLELPDRKQYCGEVIWDESKDGEIPSKFKGKEKYLKRSGNKLVEDSDAKIIFDSKQLDKSNKQSILDDLKNFDGSDSGSGSILVKLLEHLNLR